MAGLPKIALARLKAKPDAPKSAGPPLRPNAFGGAEHPDANLLAALVEKTLTDRERTHVLNHLSQCADCREIAALTLPVEEAVAAPVPVAAPRRWNPWPVLRWGALAAVLGALTFVVVVRPGMWNLHQEISRVTLPAAPAGNITSALPSVTPSPSAPPTPEPAEANAGKSASGMAASVAAESREKRDASDHLARAKVKQQVTMMASSRPPEAYRAQNVSGAKGEQEEAKKENALAAGAMAATPPPPAAPAPVATAASADVMKPGAEPQVAPAASGVTAASVGVVSGNIGGSAGGAAPAKSSPQMEAKTTTRMAAQSSFGALRSVHKELGAAAVSPPAIWSVASNGSVQRSADGGKTFEQIHVARGVKFRVISSLADDIWAGGAHGVLYHSADGGATWNRVGISSGGSALTETIASIQLNDSQHLTVTTASGSQWSSEDAGQHWQNQP